MTIHVPNVTKRPPGARVGLVGRLVSALRPLLTSRPRGSPDDVPDYLRRDIGLPPRTESVDHWNYR